jgi:hypothetical protein
VLHFKVESGINFLEKLFADQVLMFGTIRGGGGWAWMDQTALNELRDEKLFVWSGPFAAKD